LFKNVVKNLKKKIFSLFYAKFTIFNYLKEIFMRMRTSETSKFSDKKPAFVPPLFPLLGRSALFT
jgi:hypothetical protein